MATSRCFYCPKPFTSKHVRVVFGSPRAQLYAHMNCYTSHNHWPVESADDVTRPAQGVIRGVLIGAAFIIVVGVIVWLI